MHWALKALVLMHVLSLTVRLCQASGGHDIWNNLFGNGTYNKEVRPVIQWTTPTEVNVSLSVVAIIEFDEITQTIMLTSKLGFTWIDEYLRWDPEDFDNITHLHIPQTRIWKPFVVLENSVNRVSELGAPTMNVIVRSDGVVEWTPVDVLQTSCATNIRKFPFDTQKCSMVFEALGYTGTELRMRSTNDHIEFHEYGGNTGWQVTDTEMATVSDGENDIHIICTLTLERNPTFFILNIFLPIILLSFLNICVFILPVQSGEKASFAITVFLSLAVFLTIVSENLPENSDSLSLLNMYVFMNVSLSVIIAIVSIVEIRLYHRDDSWPVSGLLRRIVKRFASKQYSAVTTVADTPSYKVAPDRGSEHNGDKKAESAENGTTTPCKVDGTVKDLRRFSSWRVLPVPGNLQVGLPQDVIWPLVVNALDNLFLLLFLGVNLCITIAMFILVIKDDIDEYKHTEH